MVVCCCVYLQAKVDGKVKIFSLPSASYCLASINIDTDVRCLCCFKVSRLAHFFGVCLLSLYRGV